MSSRDTFYFPHEYNAKDDPKCERLIWEMGMEGYGIFWALLEVLRIQPDYTYPLANIPIIAYKYRADVDKMRRVVLDFDLFTIVEDKIFFSNGLLNRMRPMDARRQKLSEAGNRGNEKRWKSGGESGGDNNPNREANRNKSRVDKSIREESKGDCKGEADKPLPVAPKRSTFVAPSPEEAIAYFPSIGGTREDAEAFFDHFTSNGWRVSGKAPMKDWQASARQWMRGKSRFSNAKAPETSRETQPRYKAL